MIKSNWFCIEILFNCQCKEIFGYFYWKMLFRLSKENHVKTILWNHHKLQFYRSARFVRHGLWISKRSTVHESELIQLSCQQLKMENALDGSGNYGFIIGPYSIEIVDTWLRRGTLWFFFYNLKSNYPLVSNISFFHFICWWLPFSASHSLGTFPLVLIRPTGSSG